MIRVLVPVGGGMSVRGVVTATDMPARHAQPEVNPMSIDPQTVFTSPARGLHRLDGVEVCARFGHRVQFLSRDE